jgi:hypothetical protein
MNVEDRQMCPVMNLDEARRVLRINRAELNRLIADGVLKTFRHGRAQLVSDEALRAAIRHLETTYATGKSEAAANVA